MSSDPKGLATETTLSAEELAELQTLAAVPYVRKELDISAWRYSVEPTYESADSSGERRRFTFLLRAHFDKMLATIDALTTENATLKAALESIVSIGRLENYADLLASGERITFSPELRETAAQVLAGKEAQSE